MRPLLRLIGAAVLLYALFVTDTYLADRRIFNPIYYRLLLDIGRFVTLAVSLTLINGITGQFSLGHAAFLAVGGYASAIVTYYLWPMVLGLPPAAHTGQYPLNWNLAFTGSMVVGGLAAALLGLLVGLPSLRLRGDYLAIVTLGMGEVVRVVFQNIDPVIGGAKGFTGIPTITNLFWVWLVAVLTILAVRNLKFSPHGRALLAIREDEIAAEAMGVPTTFYKVAAFVIGAFFAGMAGALYSHQIGSIYPTVAGFENSILIVAMVVLGGTGSITGAVFAAALLTALPEILRTFAPGAEQYRTVILAVLLVALMLTRPQGLLGSAEASVRGLFPRRKPKVEAPLT